MWTTVTDIYQVTNRRQKKRGGLSIIINLVQAAGGQHDRTRSLDAIEMVRHVTTFEFIAYR